MMERTLVGVTRDGGTVYRSHAALGTSTTTSKSQSSTLPSGLRVVSVFESIHANKKLLQAPSGRLDHFYHGLEVPMRNVPWKEETNHTVVPSGRLNPQYCSDRSRYATISRMLSVDGVPDVSIPHVADRVKRDASRISRNSAFHSLYREQSQRNRACEKKNEELDFKRVAYRSACIADYHDRVKGKVCHVI
jgi:hypothetical protein